MKLAGLILATLPALAVAQDLCDQYAFHEVNGYEFNNNNWGEDAGTGSQCTYIDVAEISEVAWHSEWTWSGGENDVKSYPHSSRQFNGTKLVNKISSIPTATSWSYSGTNIRADVAYDLFTAADPNHDTSSGDYEVMIWLANIGDIYPIGDLTGTVNVDNNDWALWVGYNGDMKVFSFVAPEQRTTFAADVMDFFDYVRDNQGFPADSQYLLTMQFGTESFTGNGATFTVNSWSGDVY